MTQNWYAVYTKRHYEQKFVNCISALISELDFDCEAYLPTVVEEIQWSDRKKRKNVPLFKNYVFVRHDENGFEKIKKLPGFCDYVRFEVYPAIIKPDQIGMIKDALENHKVSTGSIKLMQGERVRICKGPMSDYEGTLIEDQKSNNVAIEVKYFKQCLLINVAYEHLVKI